jgi:hypothetical protein
VQGSAPGGNVPDTFVLEGEATLFGFDATPAAVTVTPRSRAWRIGGAVRTLAIFVVVAPFLAIFPPHAVWPIGTALTGAFLARRHYVERFTLRGLEGVCPKCGGPLSAKPGRLHLPHPVPCDACHHEASIHIPSDALEAIALP